MEAAPTECSTLLLFLTTVSLVCAPQAEWYSVFLKLFLVAKYYTTLLHNEELHDTYRSGSKYY